MLSMPRALRGLGACLALFALLAPMGAVGGDSPDLGEAIYRRGVTGSGAPLEASRDAGTHMRGAAAACVNCHQRSGFGGREGRSVVPPITGRYLFRPLPKDGNDRDIPYVAGMRGDREPYTDVTLARAIREGLDSQGKQLSTLMPNYALNDADMAALIGYLNRLDQRRVPGVTDTTLHFATIITPDADPVKRRGMLDVFNQFFADRNVRQMGPAPRLLASGKTAYSKTMFMVHRRWELHVWELTGPESTWQQQLERHLANEPVFAVVSGLGGKTWAPIHAFCEHSGVPCLLPNIEVPVDSERDFYSLYFSKGVLLEAQLIANRMFQNAGGNPPKTYSRSIAPATAERRLPRRSPRHSSAVASRCRPRCWSVVRQALVSPLRCAEPRGRMRLSCGCVLAMSRHSATPSGAPSTVYMSGLMGGLERTPLPPAWRGEPIWRTPSTCRIAAACASTSHSAGSRSGTFRSSPSRCRRIPIWPWVWFPKL